MGKRNNDDFSFDDDLFGDDENFDSDDAGGDDFSFDDDFDSDLDIDSDSDFDTFEDVDEDFLIEEETESTGPNRTFIFLAGIMIILFLIGLGAVIFLATRPTGPSEFDLQVTERVAQNSTMEAFLRATQTQAVVDAEATATQLVVDQQATATAEFEQTQSAIEQATIDAQATVDAELELTSVALTQAALLQQQTQTQQAVFAEQTRSASGAQETPDEVEETPVPVTQAGIGDVALTATAIAEALQNPLVQVTPTFGTGGGGATPVPGQLPTTGLFDDVSGGQNMGMVALAAFALVGVIFGARRLRSMNNKMTV